MSLLTGLDPVAIVAADFNHDGRPDLAVLNKGSNDISIFLGNGHGGFTERFVTGADGQPIRLGAGNDPLALPPPILTVTESWNCWWAMHRGRADVGGQR